MAMVNPIINPLQVKDSRWLTLEVCREYQRNKCTRPETECKFAHPPPHVEVQNGRVTCCFDSIKGKCQRKDPPCKYLHPPQHLREQLLQNGRNNLIIKNLQMQALAAGMQPLIPGMVPAVMYEGSAGGKGMAYGASPGAPNATATTMLPGHYPNYPIVAPRHSDDMMMMLQAHPYLTAASNIPTYPFVNPGLPMTSMIQSIDPNNTATMSSGGQVHGMVNNVGQSAKRSDRLEGMSAMQGMMPMVKRPAVADGKSGIPMYQPAGTNTAAYQQAALAMQLQQAPYVPVTIAGHPPGVPRF